jgi:hypothetical protein
VNSAPISYKELICLINVVHGSRVMQCAYKEGEKLGVKPWNQMNETKVCNLRLKIVYSIELLALYSSCGCYQGSNHDGGKSGLMGILLQFWISLGPVQNLNGIICMVAKARSQGFSSLDVTLPRVHLSSTSRCAFCCCIINAISVLQTQMVKEA